VRRRSGREASAGYGDKQQESGQTQRVHVRCG
jgi:hypothetical protein